MKYSLGMRHLILSLAYAAPLLAGPHMAAADTVSRASACYSVSDADARASCLARARKDASRCYNVQRADMRQQCLSEAAR